MTYVYTPICDCIVIFWVKVNTGGKRTVRGLWTQLFCNKLFYFLLYICSPKCSCHAVPFLSLVALLDLSCIFLSNCIMCFHEQISDDNDVHDNDHGHDQHDHDDDHDHDHDELNQTILRDGTTDELNHE